MSGWRKLALTGAVGAFCVIVFQNCFGVMVPPGSSLTVPNDPGKFLAETVARNLSASATQNINLQTYFPSTYTKLPFAKYDGNFSQEYVFFPGDQNFYRVYNSYQKLETPGTLLIWEKRYNNSAAGNPLQDGNCVPDYGMLWLGTDQSITEVGDWLAPTGGCTPDHAFAYKDYYSGKNGGLSWSGPGGLTKDGITKVVWPENQGSPDAPLAKSTWLAYSYSALIAVLPTFTADYGRDNTGSWMKGAGKTYSNVAQIVFWHGVKDTGDPGFTPPKCPTDPNWPYSKWYLPVPGFKSYGLMYYLAPGVGVVQMDFLFNETDNYFPSTMICKGLALGSSTATPADGYSYGPIWIDYLDQ